MSSKTHAHIETKNVTLFGNRVFAGAIKLGWIKVGPISNDWCPYKEKHLDTKREYREKGNITMKVESKVI